MSDYNPEKFVNREEEIALVVDRISDLADGKPFSAKERVFHFVGPSGIGKSCLLEKICWKLDIERLKCVHLLIELDSLARGTSGVVDNLLIKVHEKFCACSTVKLRKGDKGRHPFSNHIQSKIRNDHVIVLLLDEVNVPLPADMQEIEEYLLAKFITEENRLAVLVTAGRSKPPMFNNFALRASVSNTYALPVFDEKKTCEQLETLKPGSKELAGKVQKLGSGVPGNTVKLVQHIVDAPLDIPDEERAVRSLLDDIKATNKIVEQHIPVLEAFSILQGFIPEDVVALFQCHPLLSTVVWDERKVKQEFLQLKDIQIGPGGLLDWDREKKHWAMDERTRDLFERELQMRDPKLWKRLHCTAWKMYQHWWKQYNSDAYRIKSEHHEQCLQAAEMHCSDLEG